MQPPARRATQGPRAGCFVIKNISANHGTAALDGGIERRIVGQTEVMAKPQDADGLIWI